LLPQQAAAHSLYGSGCHGLALTAAPAPVSTPSSGSVVTYTIGGIPEAATGSGIFLGLTIVSLTQDLAGTSLASFGMPGCSLWVGGLDNTTAFVGTTATQTTSFVIPAGVPGGTQLFATAVALVQAGTLNAFGAVTSNGVASFVNAF
jgi:hypothetical protein